MNDYSFFKYIPNNSKIHMLNSKMKILWFLLSIIISLVVKDYYSLLLFFIFLLFVISKTNISINVYISNLLIIYPVYLFCLFLTLFISHNFLLSVLVTIKLILIIILFLILTFTTSLSEIAWGFECVFSPLKKLGIPVSNISLSIALVIKFISTLFEKFKEVRKSMAYRGIPYNKNSLTAIKKMVFPVIRLSYKLSNRTISAMKLRFYGYGKKRTNYHENKTTYFDKVLVITDCVLIYLVIWLGWL